MSEQVDQLVKDIFGLLNKKKYRKMAEEHPEICLISLLEAIKEDLPRGFAATVFTVDLARIKASAKLDKLKLVQ